MRVAPKLLSINAYHYRRGGAEAVYFETARIVQEAGWRNAFFSMRHPLNEPCDEDRYFVDTIELGHEYTPWRKAHLATKVLYSFEAERKIDALLDAYPADIAHAHQIYHHLSPSILPALKRRGVPVAFTAHDLKLACPAYTMHNHLGVCERCHGGRLWNVARHGCVANSHLISALVMVESALHRWMKIYSKNLDVIIAPSRFYQSKLEEWGWPSAQLAYAPNFVEAGKFRFEPDVGDYLLYLGRLSPEKGLKTLIEATARSGAPVKIAGDGPQRAELEALAAKLEANVTFLGRLSGEDLSAAVTGARGAIVPSEWYENAPMSLLEAYAHGVPVIGADIGGIPELIRQGETGALFPSGDADALAGAMADWMDAPRARLADMRRAARAFVEENFSKARYQQRLFEIYARLGVKVA